MAASETLELVQKLYIAYYSRPADPAGLDYWADRIENEGLDTVINEFFVSAESIALHGADPDAATRVNILYNNIFGRDAEEGGLDYWVGKLETSGDLGALALEILEGARNEDGLLIDNKLKAAQAFTAAVAAGEVDYDGDAAAAIARSLLDLVTTEEGGGDIAPGALAAYLHTVQLASQHPEAFQPLIDESGRLTDTGVIREDLQVEDLVQPEPEPEPELTFKVEVTIDLTTSEMIYSFDGTASGDITVSITDNIASFTREGVQAETTVNLAGWVPGVSFIKLGDGQTLLLSAEQANTFSRAALVDSQLFWVIIGSGTVLIDSDEINQNTNLLGIDPRLTVSFNDSSEVTVAEGVRLTIHPHHATGVVISGPGSVETVLHDYETGPVVLDIGTHGPLNYIGGTGLDDTIWVSGTGKNLIMAGGGADRIFLSEGTGEDVLSVSGGGRHLEPEATVLNWNLVVHFDLAVDRLDLEGAAALPGTATVTVDGVDISVQEGIVNVTNTPDISGLILTELVLSATATMIGSSPELPAEGSIVAYYDGQNSFILRSSAEGGGLSDIDALVMLAGVNVTNLNDILL